MFQIQKAIPPNHVSPTILATLNIFPTVFLPEAQKLIEAAILSNGEKLQPVTWRTGLSIPTPAWGQSKFQSRRKTSLDWWSLIAKVHLRLPITAGEPTRWVWPGMPGHQMLSSRHPPRLVSKVGPGNPNQGKIHIVFFVHFMGAFRITLYLSFPLRSFYQVWPYWEQAPSDIAMIFMEVHKSHV